MNRFARLALALVLLVASAATFVACDNASPTANPLPASSKELVGPPAPTTAAAAQRYSDSYTDCCGFTTKWWYVETDGATPFHYDVYDPCNKRVDHGSSVNRPQQGAGSGCSHYSWGASEGCVIDCSSCGS